MKTSRERLKVNDVVHSFCYLCRNQPFKHVWPFTLMGMQAHMTYQPMASKGHPRVSYDTFIAYAVKNYRGSLMSLSSLLASLEITTCRWTVEEMDYAKQLMGKYYNV